MKYILAIDQGTTSTRSIIYDEQFRPVASHSREFRQIFRHAAWVEHDAEEIFNSVLETIHEAIRKAGIHANQIITAGITNQRETTVVWDKQSGAAAAHAVVWQSRQSASICDEIRARGLTDLIRQKTGLLPDPYFSASKLTWLFRNHPELKSKALAGTLAFGTIDSWIIRKLTGKVQHVTDFSNASRTMLFDIEAGKWDHELCDIFEVPVSVLPEVLPNAGLFGHIDSSFFGAEIPITGVAGDQQAALFGQACFEPGMAKNTYGTGCFMLMQTGEKLRFSENGLLSTIAWNLNGITNYALEGSVFVAGSAVQWLRDGLGIVATASETESLASSVPDSGGVYFVPAFTGLGAPYWNSSARGAFFGLTRGTTRAHIIRATLEAMAFQTKDVFDLMEEESGLPLKTLRVDGGAASNNLMMQFQSDLLGLEVDRPQQIETTALGVAMLAALGAGIYNHKSELEELRKSDRIFIPRALPGEVEKALKGWRRAVNATIAFHSTADKP
jgi:glycerol kinase